MKGDKLRPGAVSVPIDPPTLMSDAEAGTLIDRIRRPERIDAAIDAMRTVIGRSNVQSRTYGDGSVSPYDFNSNYIHEFTERFTALARNQNMTVHQAANQVVRELGHYDGAPNDRLDTRDFDRIYHATLDRLEIPQLPHETPSANTSPSGRRF